MIELLNVSKLYTTSLGQSVRALHNLSLTLPSTGMVFIYGKSGSGKSTLLNILGGLDGLSEGKLLIHGHNISKLKEQERTMYRNQSVGFVFQDFNIIDAFSLNENLSFVCELQGFTPKREELDAALAQVGLEGLGSRKGNELSGGQKQRLAIARALIKRPALILADEPTGNLDTQTSQMILDLLKNISKDHLVVVVSHEPDDAAHYADRILKIKDGKLESDIVHQEVNSPNPVTLKSSKTLSFSHSLRYAFQHLNHQKGQSLMTILVLSISILLLFLLGSYVDFISAPSQSLILHYGQTAILNAQESLLKFLSLAQAKNLMLGTSLMMGAMLYVIFSASVDQRIKTFCIYQALGAQQNVIRALLVGESGAIIGVSMILGSLSSLLYIFNINTRFFDGIAYFQFNGLLALSTLVLLSFGTLGLNFTLLIHRFRKTPMIDVLKGE